MSDKIIVLNVKNTKTGQSQVYRIDKKRIVFGSALSSDVKLADPQVSPVHAILEASGTDGRPVIYDLASDTGIKLNQQSVVQSGLNPNDRIQIGPFEVVFDLKSLNDAKQSPGRMMESFGKKLFVNEKDDLAPLIAADSGNVIDIFDRRPESKQSLQVVMFYRDTILDVEHFVNKKRIVIGPGRKEDFSIPPFMGEGKGGQFELVTNENGQYSLHLHKSMKGVVSKDGNMVRVGELMDKGQSTTLALSNKDFAKVQLNDVSFFMNYTSAPPKLRKPLFHQTDPFFAKIWVSSLILSSLIMYTFSNIVVEPTIEIEQLPERVATIIYEPKFLPVEKPKPIPTPVATQEVKPVVPKTPPPPKVIKVEPKPVTTPAPKNPVIAEHKEQPKKAAAPTPVAPPKQQKPAAQKASGQEGEGAKAKGTEGSRGKQNAPKADTHQTKALRPGEGKKTDAASSGKGNSQTQDLGVVDIFKSNNGTLSKVLSGGKGASNAADKLEGYSGFSTQGAGGLGATGGGSGGGGQSMGLGGLSDKGAGGGKHGTGLGALGSGGNILGGKGKIAIDSGGGAGEPVVMGAIDTDAIAREINKYRDQIKYCYEKEVNAENPDLAGRVSIQFVIGASGVVSSAGVKSTSLKNANTESCVVDVIKRIKFPPVRGGGIADVTYPFLFKPSNR